MNAPQVFILDSNAIARAREQAQQQDRPLVEVLEEQSALAPEHFAQALAQLFDYPFRTMLELQQALPAFNLVSFPEMASRQILLLQEKTQLLFVLADPLATDLEAWAQHRISQPFVTVLAHRNDIAAYLSQREQKLRAMDAIINEASSNSNEETTENISLVKISEDQSPVIKLVNSTLYDALKMQASDIHFECEPDGLAIKYRIDGVLVPVSQITGLETAEQAISRIKVLAELDIAERRIPQDGRFKVRMQQREVDFRVSIMPNIYGEDAVLRLLDRRALTESANSLRLDHLGLNQEAIEAIRWLSTKPYGMLLVTGPTGSGKTTTLYAAISEINTGRDKIITIEDPVEYRLSHILQIPVNEKKGLTFARGLRSILRHDPDKIMVGEIRDSETAQIAVQAALTGHLVFTTVHANNVFDVLGRFLYMNVDPYGLSAALNGILAQRLLRLNCEHCSVEFAPSNMLLKESGLTEEQVKGWNFRAGSGCGHCRGSGYKGRKAIAEILILNDTLREMIATKAPLTQMKEAAHKLGNASLRETALLLVKRGETTLEEANRVIF